MLAHAAPLVLTLGALGCLTVATMPQPGQGRVVGVVCVLVLLVTALWALCHDGACSRCATAGAPAGGASLHRVTAALLRLFHHNLRVFALPLYVASAVGLALSWLGAFGQSPLVGRLIVVAWMLAGALAVHTDLTHSRLRSRCPRCPALRLPVSSATVGRGASGRPVVRIVDAHPDVEIVPEEHRYWGYAEPDHDGEGWRIVRTGHHGEASRGAEAVGEVGVAYRDPCSGSTATRRLSALLACPHDRWLWAETGWVVDDPGPVPDDPALDPPFPDFAYEVRSYWVLGEPHLLPRYSGWGPHWRALAWCATEPDARRIADALMSWHDPHRSASQVWGPDGAGRRVVFTNSPSPGVERPPLPTVPTSTQERWPQPAPARRLPAAVDGPPGVDVVHVVLGTRPQRRGGSRRLPGDRSPRQRLRLRRGVGA